MNVLYETSFEGAVTDAPAGTGIAIDKGAAVRGSIEPNGWTLERID